MKQEQIKPHKKYVASLPPNFQEVLMSSEMELQQGLNVQILRKLVYLYTRGMQYYDLIHKDKFRQFYSDKLISLLTLKPVEKFLDENPINFEDKDDLDLLFDSKEKKENEEENNIKNEINYEMRDFSSQIRKNSMKLVKNKLKDYDLKMYIKKKLLEVNSKLNKIDQALSNEMIEQMSEFEENKRKRKIKKSNKNINNNINSAEKKENIIENIIQQNEIILNDITNNEKTNTKESLEDKNTDTNSVSTPNSKGEEETQKDNKNIINTPEDELKILELSGVNINKEDKISEEKNVNSISNNSTPTKSLIGNNPMLREIEDYLQKNMNEMYQALEELKASFQEEINEAEENGFDSIAEGLKEDLQVELDNLKDQYEEQRRIETEKIKKKYSKRNNVIMN